MCVLRLLLSQPLHKKKPTQKTTTIHKHTMPKRHADTTQDENPSKRRQVYGYEDLAEAGRNGDTTAVRAVLEELHPYGTQFAFDAAYEACKGNHNECLALLIPYVTTSQAGFGMLLSECVHADHVACTEVLLQHWKSVCNNADFVSHTPNLRVGEDISCPAMWADPAVCRVFIDAGADIETKDDRGSSPLHWACRSGTLDVVKMLVEAGAGVRVTDNKGQTCLTLAAKLGRTETVRCLVGLPEVDVNHRDTANNTALHLAAHENHTDVTQVLIDAGADIDIKNSDGSFSVHVASLAGALDVVKMLLRVGAGVCVTDNEGDTCLTLATYFGYTEIVRYLVGLPEVDVNHRDGNNDTALHLAAQENHTGIAQVLIDAGADIGTKDDRGSSPLHRACHFGALDIVKMLVEAGAGVHVTDHHGSTCLTLAAELGRTETVRYLVGLPGVDVNHRDGDNDTALHLARKENHTDTAQLLIAAGADMDTENTDGRSP